MVWCGERTRQLDAAHLEFMRGIGNPIGVKISDKMGASDLVTMIGAFNPSNVPGRLAVVVRMGADKARGPAPPRCFPCTLLSFFLCGGGCWIRSTYSSWKRTKRGPLHLFRTHCRDVGHRHPAAAIAGG
jgi:hypothetical protein